MVFVETPSPFIDPPPEIVELTAWDHPSTSRIGTIYRWRKMLGRHVRKSVTSR